MMTYAPAFLIGVIAGLRAMTAPAAVSWAARAGRLKVRGTWLSFMGHSATPLVFTVAALGELVTDQLPKTPSRKVPVQFGGRIACGAISGAAIGTLEGKWMAGLACGAAGAIVGTLGGAAVRERLAASFGKDRPAALLEDAVALGGAAAVVRMLP